MFKLVRLSMEIINRENPYQEEAEPDQVKFPKHSWHIHSDVFREHQLICIVDFVGLNWHVVWVTELVGHNPKDEASEAEA